MKKNKKGFTLIELLAVIIILGVLLLISVPAVSKYIDNSRKNTYVNSVKSMVSAVSTSVNALEFPFTIGKNQGLIIPFSEISLEKKSATKKSPFAEWETEKSYVLIVFDGNNYKYYISALDKNGYAIPLINEKELTTKSITTNKTIIDTTIISYQEIINSNGNNKFDTSFGSIQYLKHENNIVQITTEITIIDNNITPMENYEFPFPIEDKEKKVLKVLIVDIDPIMTKGTINGINCSGKTASECLGHNKQQAIDELIVDIEESSHGIIDVEIVKTEKLNEFATHTKQVTLLNGQKSYKLDEDTWLDMMKNGWYNMWNDPRINEMGAYTFDYKYLLNKLNLVERRNNNEFDEIWLVNEDPSRTYESIMVGKSAYWINGAETKADCTNFKIMNVSISRPDVNFECYGHATENIMNNVFGTSLSYSQNNLAINQSNYSNLNLWQKFTLVEHHNRYKGTGLSGVGDVHFSPNSTKDYDWGNKTNNVTSKWREWLNYPNLTNNPSTELFTPTIYLNSSLSGTRSDARLHHRWWFSLFPHLTGYTSDGYSNNWWDYYYLGDFVTTVNATNKNHTIKKGESLDKIEINLTYKSQKTETIKIDKYENNMSFSNKSIFGINSTGKIIAKEKGTSELTYYRDGKSVTINITVE